MADEERFATVETLGPVIRAALGRGSAPTDADRLAGGSKKGVYRTILNRGGTVLVYVWSDGEDYWEGTLPEGSHDLADPFSHTSGLPLFEVAADKLTSIGVRTPRILFSDSSQTLYPADVAVVEDVRGGSLEALLQAEPAAASRPLSVVGDWLGAMAAVQSPSLGKVAFVEQGGESAAGSCEELALSHALAQVAELASLDRRVSGAQQHLNDLLRGLATALEPRSTWGLVHGELGPDHVLLDDHGDPVLIDIEGAKYFDIEAEHVWARMRFGPDYNRFQPPALDEARLRFYQLCMHIDLVAGPLRIADTDHPQSDWFRSLAERHLVFALTFPPDQTR